jgi:hypothetical protein
MIHRPVMLGLVAVAVASGPARAVAQSAVVLDDGQRALGGAAGFLTNDDATMLAVGADYVKDGWIDLGLLLARYGFDDNAYGGADVSAIGVQPGIQLHFLKGSDAPVSAYGAASIQYLVFSDDIPGTDISGWSFTLAGGVYRELAITPKIRAVPQAQLYYTRTSATVSSPFGETSDADDTVGLGMIGNVVFSSKRATSWIIAPQLAVDDDHVTVGIFAGAVIRR